MQLRYKEKRKEVLFDNEVLKWNSLYGKELKHKKSWGIFQKSLQKRAQKRLETCLSIIRQYKPEKVLDVGCGTGAYGSKIIKEGMNWNGMDISMKMLKHCRENLDGLGSMPPLVSGSLLQLPIKPNHFDMILNIGVLSYFKRSDVEKGLRELFRALKPSGILITQSISIDPITWIRSRLPLFSPRPVRVPGPLYPYSPHIIKKVLKETGFSIIDIVTLYKYGFLPAAWIYVGRKS